VLAAAYTWTAGGSNDAWNNCDNWNMEGLGQRCFPSTGSDDAGIPFALGGYTVELRTYTMDDLVIGGDVAFTTDSTARTLTVDSININGPAHLTFRNEAKIAG